jgi:isopenicillin N synthase-like dioxygenase
MKKYSQGNSIGTLDTDGYLRLSLNKVESDILVATFKAAYSFFNEPLDKKMTNSLPQDMGYRPIGIEYSQSPERPDLAESFAASMRAASAIEALPSHSGRVLYRRMLSTISVLDKIAETIIIEIANTLCESPIGDKLRGGFRRWSRLQLNYSQPATTTSLLINDPHEDGDLLTIACADGPGLELKTPSGEFIPVTTALNEVLIIPGEIAWLLSGGRIRPLWHRVQRVPHCRERMALLFFGDIDPGLCAPWVNNSVNLGIDIGARVLTSVTRFGLAGFTPEWWYLRKQE